MGGSVNVHLLSFTPKYAPISTGSNFDPDDWRQDMDRLVQSMNNPSFMLSPEFQAEFAVYLRAKCEVKRSLAKLERSAKQYRPTTGGFRSEPEPHIPDTAGLLTFQSKLLSQLANPDETVGLLYSEGNNDKIALCSSPDAHYTLMVTQAVFDYFEKEDRSSPDPSTASFPASSGSEPIKESLASSSTGNTNLGTNGESAASNDTSEKIDMPQNVGSVHDLLYGNDTTAKETLK
ncbi:MAG: hypothetical protein Q9164_007001, partial [Protoblastenia rupestris]